MRIAYSDIWNAYVYIYIYIMLVDIDNRKMKMKIIDDDTAAIVLMTAVLNSSCIQGADLISPCHFASIGSTTVELKWHYGHFIFTMRVPILVKKASIYWIRIQYFLSH